VAWRKGPWGRRSRRGDTAAEPHAAWEWPVRLTGRTPTGVGLLLRPLVVADGPTFHSVRRANAAWLEPWDATSPDPQSAARSFEELVAQYESEAVSGRSLPLVVEVGGRLVGQVNAGTIVLGSFRSCTIGYWVSRSVAGQMVTPTALAVLGDHLVGTVGLHRVEVNIRPENTASLAVVRKLGFRSEGRRRNYLHIAGAWRDHLSFALTTEDLAGESMTARLARIVAAEDEDRRARSSHEPLVRHTDRVPGPDAEPHLPS
jgi:ribosomal-protein-alanine N-acetyltransferase